MKQTEAYTNDAQDQTSFVAIKWNLPYYRESGQVHGITHNILLFSTLTLYFLLDKFPFLSPIQKGES